MRLQIPSRGSPGCTLVFGSLVMGLIGIPLTILGVVAVLRGEGDQTDNILLLAVSVVATVIAVVLAVSGFKKDDSPLSVFSSDTNPLERATNAKKEGEREAANREIVETSQTILRLAQSDYKLLDKIRSTARDAPSNDEVVRILAKKAGTEIRLANPALQPIAFSMKLTTAWSYSKGVIIEGLTWGLVVVAIPLMMVSDAWSVGRIVLHRALRLSRLARQYRVRSHKRFELDGRLPCLYLRSFSLDDSGAAETFLPTTAEEKLVRSYERIGPVIALGNPREKLPLLGASRLYFDNSTWQPAVLYLMSISRLVIIQAGSAENLLQEVAFAHQRLDPRKVMISFSAWEDLDEWTRQLQYLRFKKFADGLLECKLPDDIQKTSHLTFDEGWVPTAQSDLSYSLPSVRKRRAKIKRLTAGVLAIVGVLWALFIAPLAFKTIVRLTGLNRYKENAAHWAPHSLDLTGISVDLPGNPTKVDQPPAVFTLGLQDYSEFRYDAGDLICSMISIKYSAGYTPPNETLLRSVSNAICGYAGVDVSTPQLGYGKVGLNGKCSRDENGSKLRGYCFTKGQDLWLILVLFESNNNDASRAADRILDSVNIAGFDTYKGSAVNWKHYPIGSTGMSVELPDSPTKIDQTIIDFELLECSIFKYDAGDLVTLIRSEMYFGDVLSVNEERLRRIATDLCDGNKVSNFGTQQIGNGKLGLDGTCSRKGKEFKLRGSCFTKGQNLWLILSLYDSSDDQANLAVDRILNSVNLPKPRH